MSNSKSGTVYLATEPLSSVVRRNSSRGQPSQSHPAHILVHDQTSVLLITHHRTKLDFTIARHQDDRYRYLEHFLLDGIINYDSKSAMARKGRAGCVHSRGFHHTDVLPPSSSKYERCALAERCHVTPSRRLVGGAALERLTMPRGHSRLAQCRKSIYLRSVSGFTTRPIVSWGGLFHWSKSWSGGTMMRENRRKTSRDFNKKRDVL